jgi:hypothetical protein
MSARVACAGPRPTKRKGSKRACLSKFNYRRDPRSLVVQRMLLFGVIASTPMHLLSYQFDNRQTSAAHGVA